MKEIGGRIFFAMVVFWGPQDGFFGFSSGGYLGRGDQFYFRYLYLLTAMGRNAEHYHEDFLRKLLHPQVVSHVRFLPRTGRTLQSLANHCDEIEKELNIRKKQSRRELWADAPEGASIYAVSSGHGRSQARGRGGRGGGRSRGGGRGGGRSTAVSAAMSRVDAWGVTEGSCWHCFKKHSKEVMCQESLACLFCGAMGHKSAFCPSAPSTKEEFEAAQQKRQ